MTDIDVFVLAYNDAQMVGRAIESALDQTYRNFRLTVLENGSTDRTREVIERYRKDPRVSVVYNTKNLKSEMGAKALMTATCPYLSILFSDDAYQPNRLETMMEAIGHHAAVFSNNSYVNERGEPIAKIPASISSTRDVSLMSPEEHLRAFFLKGNSLHPCAMLVRTEDYQSLGGFKGYLHRIGDMQFFTKLVSRRPVKFIPDRLQNITVWGTGRNVSYENLARPDSAAYERLTFLDLYAQDPILRKVDRIFSSPLDHYDITTDAERLWFLGHVALGVKAYDYQLFGARCLYRALEMDEDRINRVCMANGQSAGDYMDNLVGRLGKKITLREFMRQFAPVRFVYRALRTAGSG